MTLPEHSSRIFTELAIAAAAAAKLADDNGLLSTTGAVALVGVTVVGFAGLMAIRIINATFETRDAVRDLKSTVSGEMGLVKQMASISNIAYDAQTMGTEAITRLDTVDENMDGMGFRLDRLEQSKTIH